ncbi:alkylation response protein AidB-like acyl-CoA dehydrogenase [Streptomyces canus]|nr:alkylation response protein AidB-like acyl-CoA dehydrogenase [Streptomyces canus]
MPTTPPASLAPFLTTAHLQLWEQVEAFATGEAAARVERMEAAPHQVERKLPQIMAKLGWFGITIPPAYAGACHDKEPTCRSRTGTRVPSTIRNRSAASAGREAGSSASSGPRRRPWSGSPSSLMPGAGNIRRS